MKYLFYSNTGLSSKQIGLTAEFIAKCIAENHLVKIVECNNVLENCYFNPLHNIIACASCQSRMNKLQVLAGVEKDDVILLKKYNFHFESPEFENLNELLSFSYNDVNIGRGAASSIISYFRDYNISSDKYRSIIDLELKKAINVYLNFKEILEQEKPDKVFLFNGRFGEVFPLLDYCQKNEIPYATIESGALTNYEIFENSLPHSIENRTKTILELWNEETDEVKKSKIGHDWFIKKRFGDESIERSFTKWQDKGSLPLGFNKSLNNILILNSSEDELKAIQEWNSGLFETQNEAIRNIISQFKNRENVHFYLRVHPNLGKVKNVQMQEIESMNTSNLTVIGPNEKIDTYALLDACDKTIVFGSTSGIEASYWGNVSILLGKSFYYLLDETCYKPTSFEELYGLIESKTITAKPQEFCLPYGYYFSSYGIKTKDFQYNGLDNSTFKGEKIKKWYLSSFLYLVKYLKDISKWKNSYKSITGKKLKLSHLFRFKV